MQIGVMNHPARDPVAEIRWAGIHRFDFVDFTLEPPASSPELIDPPAVRAALAEYGLGVVAHTAWFIPLGSPYPAVREAGLQEFRKSLKAASAIGATVMNVHYRPVPPAIATEQVVEWHAETLLPLCEQAAAAGVTIVLEHVPEGGPRQLENVLQIMQRVPRLRFHLDSGHAKLEARLDRYDEYLERLGDRLLHVHLSDNDGTADQHLPPGAAPRSHTDWPAHVARLKATGYDGTITLEVFAPCREYLLLSRDLLRRWWDEAPPAGGPLRPV